jgi:hypothetical protein
VEDYRSLNGDKRLPFFVQGGRWRRGFLSSGARYASLANFINNYGCGFTRFEMFRENLLGSI